MGNIGADGRSFKELAAEDLARLRKLAVDQRTAFFDRHPDWGLYANRVLCTALCQGAALHFARGICGINDFDVYTFYAHDPRRAWYAKARARVDFGDPKFGQSADKPQFVGRRVDLMGRGIPALPGDGPVLAVQRYLARGGTKTARLLAEKAVVLLEPPGGKLVWLLGKPAV